MVDDNCPLVSRESNSALFVPMQSRPRHPRIGPFGVMVGVPIDCSGAFVGCERMPAALRAANLAGALDVDDVGNLQVTIADPLRDPETGVIGLRDVLGASAVVKRALADLLADSRKPLLIGGDCTLLIGVAGALRSERPGAGLMFVDGHLDCYDGKSSPTGECADMELAILLGIGPGPLVNFAGEKPLLDQHRVAVLGPSDEASAALDGAPDPRQFAPAMWIVGVEELTLDPGGHARAALEHLDRGRSGFWLHLDLDVLSCDALPAVDYPTKEGLTWEQLLETLRPVFADDSMLGASVVIFNPTKDPEGVYAARIIQLLRDAADDTNVSVAPA